MTQGEDVAPTMCAASDTEEVRETTPCSHEALSTE